MIYLMISFYAAFLFIFICLVYKFRNPYKLIMIFGKKGSGKSTLITKLAYKYYKAGRPVFATIETPFSQFFDVQQLGQYVFPEESVVFIDEVGMIWDNRQYKNFRNDVRDYFKLQRHYKNTVYLFSQSFDVDIKLRNLTDYMYLSKCYFGFISVSRKIRRNIVLVEATAEGESRIADNLEFTNILTWILDGAIFTFIPRWVKYFDSHVRADLPEFEYNVDVYVRKSLTDFVKCCKLYVVTIVTTIKRALKRFGRRRL